MNEAKCCQIIAGELNIRAVQVSHTVELLDWACGGPRPSGLA